jgi:hypothetical protein
VLHYTGLKRFAKDKHVNILVLFVIMKKLKRCEYDPRLLTTAFTKFHSMDPRIFSIRFISSGRGAVMTILNLSQ